MRCALHVCVHCLHVIHSTRIALCVFTALSVSIMQRELVIKLPPSLSHTHTHTRLTLSNRNPTTAAYQTITAVTDRLTSVRLCRCWLPCCPSAAVRLCCTTVHSSGNFNVSAVSTTSNWRASSLRLDCNRSPGWHDNNMLLYTRTTGTGPIDTTGTSHPMFWVGDHWAIGHPNFWQLWIAKYTKLTQHSLSLSTNGNVSF